MASAMPESHSRILAAVAAIPRGKVASYGQVAAIAGMPGRSRLVGWVLRHAPDDRPVPWHRVMRAGGVLAFAQGSAPFQRQRAALAREGVVVVHGRVDLARHGWRRDLDEVLWGPAAMAPPRRRAK